MICAVVAIIAFNLGMIVCAFGTCVIEAMDYDDRRTDRADRPEG